MLICYGKKLGKRRTMEKFMMSTQTATPNKVCLVAKKGKVV